ncbi:MAG: DegT/DnrJ/EryC1/StrS family aminotransferase [Deltaproteobacteria bacterium]|nr:DegT/DnrJ/EryC1/StrS family aminotransferase [Deltaproteobacteria bacterium]
MREAGGSARVPFLDLSREYDSLASELEPAVLEILRSQQYILGPAAERFETEVARYLDVPHAIGVSSGTDALWLALAVLDVGPGDEVVTTPFTFFATASSIVRTGAVPVFADVRPDDLLIDPDAVARVVGPRTRALLPVDLYGQCADGEALDTIARRSRIGIVEDAAQAIGARRGAWRAGSFGDLACFSFYPTKNLAACGEAGLVTTADDRLAARVRRLRDHGSERRYEHLEIGFNARLDAIQAAVLSVKLRHLDEWNEARRARAATYAQLLGEAGLDGDVRPLTIAPDSVHVFHQYVVRVRKRDALRSHLEERGIGTAIHYPLPLHLQPCFAGLGYRKGDLPEAERAAEDVLALPIFPELRREEQERVVRGIAEFYR